MAKKSAKGGGTIRKKTVTRAGKEYTYWEARITVGRDPGTGKQLQRSFTGKSQKEVREKLSQAVAALDTGTYTDPSKLTVGSWLDVWSADYLGGVKSRTVDSYKAIIHTHIKPALGALKLEELTAHTIQHFYNNLSKLDGEKPKLSPKSVKNVHGVFHKALEQAVKLGYIRFNPSNACALPRVEQKDVTPLDIDGIIAFMKAVQGHRFEAILLTMLYTGLRRGEACGLTWDAVDLDHGTIIVNKQLQGVRGQRGVYELSSTKNGKGRTITIAPAAVDLLRRHRIRQTEHRLIAGQTWEDSGFVFTDELGRHLSPHTVYHNFKRLAASIGLSGARLHDLRHTAATVAIASGADVKSVQNMMGHFTAAFTLDRYAHATDQMMKDTAERVQSFYDNLANHG